MLIDVSTQKTPSKAFLKEKITPLLPDSVVPSFLDALADDSPNHPGGQKVKSMPNSFLPPSVQGKLRDSKEGVLLAGDAMNMRHPLTGGGMSVALNDAVILTELLGGGYIRARRSRRPSLNGTDHTNGKDHANGNRHASGAATSAEEKEQSESSDDDSVLSSTSSEDAIMSRSICNLEDWWEVRNRLEEWHWRRKGVGTCVNVLAMALYTLFGAEGGLPSFAHSQVGLLTQNRIHAKQTRIWTSFGKAVLSTSCSAGNASKAQSACYLRAPPYLFTRSPLLIFGSASN